MKDIPEGFREAGHGADVALEVWAPGQAQLFKQAAMGMYDLLGATGSKADSISRTLTFSARDDESLLVAFLSQLLFMLEQEHLIFTGIELEHRPGRLKAFLNGVPLHAIQREIKAVTFNNLEIRFEDRHFRACIVFDL